MGRPLRIESPAAFYYITSRGNACQAVKDDQDKIGFLDILTNSRTLPVQTYLTKLFVSLSWRFFDRG